MTGNGVLQLVVYVVVLLALAKPLGAYMARVYEGRPLALDRVLGWLERLIYKLSGVRPGNEMGWMTYAVTMLLFNLAGVLVVYALQRLQGLLPLNPQQLGAVSPDSSFNTAVSFATNTNWRSEEHTSELQSRLHLVCRLLLEKKKKNEKTDQIST